MNIPFKMVYESSYESGRKPFQPDTTRGYWEQPTDFIFICMGLAFKLDFFFSPMIFFVRSGIAGLIPYLICLGLYVVPLMVIHAFMGQFSSSSYISAFRISPLFKGMGYISLALNFAILTYYSALTTVPMLFLFNSLKPTLPWSCEAFEDKSYNWNATSNERITICNKTATEIMNMKDIQNDTNIFYELPSVLFFQSHIGSMDYDRADLTFSWELFICTLLTWAIIAGIFYKFFNTAKLGKLLRYGIWVTLSLLVICVLRFMFLPGAIKSLSVFFVPEVEETFMGLENALVFSMAALGPGWGSIVALSSHNKFNTNIMRDSWIICLSQMVIHSLFNFGSMLVQWHFSEFTEHNFLGYLSNHWDIYLSGASAIANMKFANFWSLMYYSMLTMAALIVMVTQLYTFLVTIFDEFECLRAYKLKVTLITIGVLAFLSIYLCTNEGVLYFSALSVDSVFTQTALNLLLLLVILWIYGRERFQRDIEFMLNQPFATWKINMLRFVAPICLIIILLISLAAAFYEHMFGRTFFHILALIFIFLPWISIPAYGAFIIVDKTGPWLVRIKRSCRPTDWYPVEQENRQRYEEAMGNENITHQLNELGEEVL